MVNLQRIKNTLRNAVSGLSSDKKAELYFQDRKRYIKLGMEGKPEDALKLLKRNNEFYKDHFREDPDAFHKAHHDFLSWSHDYTYYQAQREVIAYADREIEMFKEELDIMEFLESALTNYKEYNMEEFLDYALQLIGTCKKRLNRDIKYYSEDLIPDLERMIEDNEYYQEHGYFQDVDPLGYKDIKWEEYIKYRNRIEPVKDR